MKGNLPDVDYKCADKRKRVTNKEVDDDPPNADERLFLRDKFLVKFFIPIMDALDINLKKSAII